jgi:hypothetical protein
MSHNPIPPRMVECRSKLSEDAARVLIREIEHAIASGLLLKGAKFRCEIEIENGDTVLEPYVHYRRRKMTV